jgi:hypothetical protein
VNTVGELLVSVFEGVEVVLVHHDEPGGEVPDLDRRRNLRQCEELLAQTGRPVVCGEEGGMSKLPSKRSAPTLPLNAARAARRDLAIFATLDAHASGDADAFNCATPELVDLNERLFAEEWAERGYMPVTVSGCVAVLNVAARIVELCKEEA